MEENTKFELFLADPGRESREGVRKAMASIQKDWDHAPGAERLETESLQVAPVGAFHV